MTIAHPMPATTASLAHGAWYDVVLLAHVLSALVGLGTVVVAGGYALALYRSGPDSEAVRRYYRPGVNWAGRVLFLVPVFGVVLVLMSRGDWSFSDGWVADGLTLWAVAAAAGELVLWPAERRLQVAVGDSGPAAGLRSQCIRVMTSAAGVTVVLIVATVVMVAKP
jgi:hypothetical protein